ncbi:MAG TPA: sigma-70 family RNA polymerase sigma factor [Planctomycetota bacterium]|nr:sigma-70 family RNA polymerase sigma factor [Planctomycetota bacterium]
MDTVQRDVVVRQVQTGNRDAYRLLVEDLEREVRGFVAAHASSLELVDEMVQSAFVEAYRQLHTYELRGTFASWVKGFARNLLKRELAQRARLVSTDQEALDSLVSSSALDDLADERAADSKREDLARIERCLAALTPRARLMVQRRFVEQVPINRIAQQFKKTRAAIANALTRIRAGLRLCVDASGDALSIDVDVA